MMLGQERPFTARQNIGIVLARVQLTGIRRDGDSVNWRAEIVKCSCWYSPRCHDLWAGIAAEHRYCNFQGADALTKLYKCESAIKKRHLHFLKLLFHQAALRVGRTLRKEKKAGFSSFFFCFELCRTRCSEAINLIVYFRLLALALELFPMPDPALFWMKWSSLAASAPVQGRRDEHPTPLAQGSSTSSPSAAVNL